MSPNKRGISLGDRQMIQSLHKTGMSQIRIAQSVKCSRNGVQTALKRYAMTQSHHDRPKSGRNRKTTPRAERQLVRMSLASRRKTSSELASDLKEAGVAIISPQTVRKRLFEHGLRGCKARKKPLLTERHRKARLEWAKKHKNWKIEDWAKVLWSDESNIEMFGSSGTTYVRRRQNEEFHPDCVVPTVKFGGGSVMIWGCISSTGVGEVFICDGRMNSSTYTSMLSEVLLPSVQKVFETNVQPTFTFQQDNAPCHTSAVSKKWFRENKITVLEWPAQSPDLNPIEHLWPMLKKKVSQCRPKSKSELILKIKDEWAKIEVNFCQKIINNMPERVAAVIKAKGGVTKY